MCVIMYKPKGKKMPNTATLQSMFLNNPDGAGIAYRNGGQWHVLKGMMELDELLTAIRSRGLGRLHDVIVHCRIATSGLVDGGACHPFPISGKERALRAVKVDTNYVLAHNGILANVDAKSVLSDTQLFIRDVVSEVRGELDSPAVLDTLEDLTIGNRLCIGTPKDVHLTGDWQEDNGIFYSNGTYKPTHSRFTDWYKTYKQGYSEDWGEYWSKDGKPAYEYVNDKYNPTRGTIDGSSRTLQPVRESISDELTRLCREDQPDYWGCCEDCVHCDTPVCAEPEFLQMYYPEMVSAKKRDERDYEDGKKLLRRYGF